MASSDLQITHTAVWTIWDPLLLRHVVRQRAPHDAHHFGDVGVEVGEDGALGTCKSAQELHCRLRLMGMRYSRARIYMFCQVYT